MPRIVLQTVPEVIDALGGPQAAGRIIGRSPQAICQWQTHIPAELYLIVSKACAIRGFDAPTWLFRFEAPTIRQSM